MIFYCNLLQKVLEKENSLGQVLHEWHVFFITQYIVDIFSKTLKSLHTNKFGKCTDFNQKVLKLKEQAYPIIKMYSIKARQV